MYFVVILNGSIMSSSLYESITNYDYIPDNCLEYIEGEKKFGELQKGDVIYMGMFVNDSITVYELKLKNTKIHIKNDLYYLSLNDKFLKTATFGPRATKVADGKRTYSSDLIPESSICVKESYLSAFGTNKNTVIEFIKMGVAMSIERDFLEISKLESNISDKKKSLENIVLK